MGGGRGGKNLCAKNCSTKKIPTIHSVFFFFARWSLRLGRGGVWHGAMVLVCLPRANGGGLGGGSSHGCQLFERTLAIPDGDRGRGDIQS